MPTAGRTFLACVCAAVNGQGSLWRKHRPQSQHQQDFFPVWVSWCQSTFSWQALCRQYRRCLPNARAHVGWGGWGGGGRMQSGTHSLCTYVCTCGYRGPARVEVAVIGHRCVLRGAADASPGEPSGKSGCHMTINMGTVTRVDLPLCV